MTCKAVRRVQRQFRKAPSPTILSKILRANERLAAQHSIDQHVVNGLINTLRNEKKRRQRGKRLNLVGEEDSGPQFFSPSRVQAARDRRDQKEMEEAQRQQDILDKRAQAALKKQQKEAEKAQRSELTAKRRELAVEAKAQEAAQNQAQKELKEAVIEQTTGQLEVDSPSKMSKKSQKARKKQVTPSITTIIAMEQEEVVLTTSRGRRVQLPHRFMN